VLDRERDRIFNDWLAVHKGILFKSGHGGFAAERIQQHAPHV